MWPNVNSYARDLIKNTIEPILQEAMLPYKLGDFKFERIVLGNIVSCLFSLKNMTFNLFFYFSLQGLVELKFMTRMCLALRSSWMLTYCRFSF